jgi:hypothetical protein
MGVTNDAYNTGILPKIMRRIGNKIERNRLPFRRSYAKVEL